MACELTWKGNHQTLFQEGLASKLQVKRVYGVHDEQASFRSKVFEANNWWGKKTEFWGDVEFLQRDKKLLKLLLRRHETKLYRVIIKLRERQATKEKTQQTQTQEKTHKYTT